MSVLHDILVWSLDRPLWQRDALRRIVTQDTLRDEDIRELCLLCLEENQIFSEADRAPVARPFTAEHLPPGNGPAQRVQLVGIRDVQGVNALAPQQRMSFLPDGMTVIFGYNGSGKSGYARILRSLCHARHRGDAILSNAFADDEQPPPSATIDYRVGGGERMLLWRQGDGAAAILGQACFFDSDCAVVHVDGTNELAFTPFGLDVLQKLVRVCQAVSGSIDTLYAEQAHSKPARLIEPAAAAGTAVRRLVDVIDKDTDLQAFTTLAAVTTGEVKRLEELQEALGADPAAKAREVRNAVARLQRLKSITEEAAGALSVDAINTMRMQLSESITKNCAATAAAEKAFRDQPLAGVGEAAWQQLWNAARLYSVEVAYRNEDFPYVGDESLCVLCHQPLSLDAKERLSRFESFIKAETRKAADDAKNTLLSMVGSFRQLNVGRSAVVDYIRDISDDHVDLKTNVRLFHGIAWKARQQILSSCALGAWTEPSAIPNSPVQEIEDLIQSLTEHAEELDSARNEEVRAKLLLERDELLARQWLGTVLVDVEAEVSRLQMMAALEAARRSTTTTGITRKSTELTETYVTATIRRKFSAEAHALGASYLRIQLEPHGGQRGALLFKLGLQGAAEDVRVRQILSEGEFRCIAFAGFLAELSTEGSGSALVFDDPVSSLDHRWRRRIARKLAQEVRQRQVIVFTHDIAFLNDLTEFCAEHGCQIQHSYLQRGSSYAGECLDGLPWPAMKVRERIGMLKSRQQEAASLFRRDGEAAYEPEARQIYGLLRETWERCVEELLINGAVMRFQRSVQTQRLSPLTDITADDVAAIDSGMTKCSRFLDGHDEPEAVMDPVPEPDELLGDIQSVEQWVQGMRRRRG